MNSDLVYVVGCTIIHAVYFAVLLLVSWVLTCSPPYQAMSQLNGSLISDKVDLVLEGLEGEAINEAVIKKAAKETKEEVEKIPNLDSIATRRVVDISYRGINVIMNVRSFHQEFEYKLYAMIKDFESYLQILNPYPSSKA